MSSVRHILYSPLAVAILSGVAFNLLAISVQFYIIFRPEQSFAFSGSAHPRELLNGVQRVNMPFSDDPQYYSLNGANSSLEWTSLQPPGDGIVFLGDDYAPYDISMWHQLRCLNYIRRTLIAEVDDYSHAEHCFHYLRQAILCSADLTLEPLPTGTVRLQDLKDKEDPTTVVTHTCKDWRQIYDRTEELHTKKPPQMDGQISINLNAIVSGK